MNMWTKNDVRQIAREKSRKENTHATGVLYADGPCYHIHKVRTPKCVVDFVEHPAKKIKLSCESQGVGIWAQSCQQ